MAPILFIDCPNSVKNLSWLTNSFTMFLDTLLLLTLTETTSLAANATISAQDTIPGHFVFNASFMSFMTSKAAKLKLGMVSFSAVLVAVEFSKTEPSQS
ncbi:hypothetical protein CR513_25240, partial [Mucuna pruriens]